jgi:hypothetical protein
MLLSLSRTFLKIQQVHGESFHAFVQAVCCFLGYSSCEVIFVMSWHDIMYMSQEIKDISFYGSFSLMDQKPLKPINVHLTQIKSYDLFLNLVRQIFHINFLALNDT